MIDLILLFIFLLFAHYIGDFALQSAFLAENKYKSFHIMFAHCMIYTGVLSLVLYFFGVLSLGIIFMILFSHIFIDKWKGIEISIGKVSIETLFHLDQVGHILIIIFLCVTLI